MNVDQPSSLPWPSTPSTRHHYRTKGVSVLMRIYVPDWRYDSGEPDEGGREHVVDIAKEIGEVVESEDVDIGRGADWPAFLVEFAFFAAPFVAIFFAGKRIEDNWDAWRRLGSRALAAIRHMNKRARRALVDQKGAAVIAIAKILEEIGSPEKCLEITTIVEVNGRIASSHVTEELSDQVPDVGCSYYFFMSIDYNAVYLVGVSELGEPCLFRRI